MALAERIVRMIARAKAMHDDKFTALVAAIAALGVPR